jgi:nitrogen fixation NifU-like protein
MAYSDKVIDHYENPRNVGSFDKGDGTVGTGMVGAPACGDVMKLQIKVDPNTGLIEDARFKTYGCGSAIASSSLITEWVKGKTLDQALTIKNAQIAEELALPPVKIHCSILAEDAIKAAVSDYREVRRAALRPAAAAARNTAAGEGSEGKPRDTERNRAKMSDAMGITLTENAAKHVSVLSRRGRGVSARRRC